MNAKLRLLALTATVALAATGCFQDNPTSVEPSTIDSSGSAEKPERRDVSTSNGIVSVVHAVPGLVVDVYVNGTLTIPGFAPGTVTDPLELAAGDYDLAVVPEGGSFPADAVITGSTTLPAGANASIVACLTETGTPTLRVFVNDVSSVRGNRSRVVVRHVAAAPMVDIRLFRPPYKNGAVLTIEDLANGAEAQDDVRKRPYWATISPADVDQVVFTTPRFNVNKSRSYIVYAYGSLDDDTFAITMQSIELPKKRGTR